MSDLAPRQGIEGKIAEKEKLLKERLLLEKERELLQRQASEVRDECQRMQDRYDSHDRKTRVNGARPKQHAIRDFIDPKDENGYSALLREAIHFCETHDGCPFLGERCKHGETSGCRGIWIKMGSTCNIFADHVKPCIKEAIGNGR
jgi:hypothetical protein